MGCNLAWTPGHGEEDRRPARL